MEAGSLLPSNSSIALTNFSACSLITGNPSWARRSTSRLVPARLATWPIESPSAILSCPNDDNIDARLSQNASIIPVNSLLQVTGGTRARDADPTAREKYLSQHSQ